MTFQNKTVVVTGGARGIGKAACRKFAEAGASVAIVDINAKLGKELCAELQQTGAGAQFFHCDISKESDVQAMIRVVVDAFSRIDVLVNNAASFILRTIDATVEEWQKILGVNIIGTALCSRYAVEVMKRQGGGAIVNIASISSVIAQAGQLTYNVSKAGVLSMTQCMAVDLAPYNIRVNAVSPGVIRTENLEELIAERHMTEEQIQSYWGDKHILGRIAKPEEIAGAILFLASDEAASFCTGANLMVDGGYTAL